MDWITSGLIPAVVALATALVTTWMILRGYYSQRWWEKKADTYQGIIEHLTFLKYDLLEMVDQHLGIKKPTLEKMEEMAKAHRQATRGIEQAAASGGFLITEEAAEVLRKLTREIGSGNFGNDLVGQLQSDLEAVSDALDSFKQTALKDLHVKTTRRTERKGRHV